MSALIIAGTDTDIGKTICAAMLTKALDGIYFKPIQAGLDGGTDLETVKRLTGLDDTHFLPEIYRLNTPASPHLAAEIDGIEIDQARLTLPETDKLLIVETAGGLMVPITKQILQIDIMKAWQQPIILCARTALGTINHTLLSVEALKARKMDLYGIIFIGEAKEDSEDIIVQFSGAKRLGRLPILPEVTGKALAQAFAANFDKADFPE